MPWELARRTRIRSEYIRRRLIELRLEVLAIRIKPNHALAILAEDHYLELVDFCRFDDTRAQPRDWKDFQADILSKPHSDQDELDLEQYIAARPYPSMARFHSRKMVDFTLYRPANLPATTDSRAPSLGSLKKTCGRDHATTRDPGLLASFTPPRRLGGPASYWGRLGRAAQAEISRPRSSRLPPA